MPWTAPVTAVDITDYLEAQYDKDADNLRWVVRPLLVLSEQDITNTALETDLFKDANDVSPVIPANAMGTGGCLRVTYNGHLANNAVSHLAGDMALYWGGSVVWNDHWEPLDNHAAGHILHLKFYVCNCGATNSQFIAGVVGFGTATPITTGTGDLSTVVTQLQGPYLVPFGSDGKTTVDTTVDQTLSFTVKNQAYPDIHVYRSQATVELIGQSA